LICRILYTGILEICGTKVNWENRDDKELCELYFYSTRSLRLTSIHVKLRLEALNLAQIDFICNFSSSFGKLKTCMCDISYVCWNRLSIFHCVNSEKWVILFYLLCINLTSHTSRTYFIIKWVFFKHINVRTWSVLTSFIRFLLYYFTNSLKQVVFDILSYEVGFVAVTLAKWKTSFSWKTVPLRKLYEQLIILILAQLLQMRFVSRGSRAYLL